MCGTMSVSHCCYRITLNSQDYTRNLGLYCAYLEEEGVGVIAQFFENLLLHLGHNGLLLVLQGRVHLACGHEDVTAE